MFIFLFMAMLILFWFNSKKLKLKRDTRNDLKDQVSKTAKKIKVQSQKAVDSEAHAVIQTKMANAAEKALKKSAKTPRAHTKKATAAKSSKEPAPNLPVATTDPRKNRPKRSSSAVVNYDDDMDDFERLFCC